MNSSRMRTAAARGIRTMSWRTWTVGREGGEIDLDESGSMVLRVPEGAFPRSTSITWSLMEIEKDGPPTIDITAKEDEKEKEIKIFLKYVEIIYKNVPTRNIGLKVEGGSDFPELQVPQQDPPCSEEMTVVEEASHHEPEEEISSQEPDEEIGSQEEEVQSIYHTYYSFLDDDTVTVYTRHFSRFNLYCKKHDTSADYDANILAVLFQKLEIVNDSVDVTVKVILDAENTRRGPYNSEFWRIQDNHQYRYMETIKLRGPPNQDIIEPGSQFMCSATVVEEEEYWEVSEKTQSQFLENCIPCRECENEILPDAALIQFSSKKPDPPDFRAKFDFSLQMRRTGSFSRLLQGALIHETPAKRVAIPVASLIRLQPEEPVIAVHQRNQEQFPASGSVCVNGRIPAENVSANLPVEVDGSTDGVGSAQSPKREDSGLSLAPSDETDEGIHSDRDAMSPDSNRFSTIGLEEINRRPDSASNENPGPSTNQVTERKFLTEKQILDLSRFLLNDYDIRNLGLNLGVKGREIDAELEKKNDKREAAHAILKLWRRGQECQVQAYDKLYKALVEVNLGHYAIQALK